MGGLLKKRWPRIANRAVEIAAVATVVVIGVETAMAAAARARVVTAEAAMIVAVITGTKSFTVNQKRSQVDTWFLFFL